MIDKELRELRRRLRPQKNNITKIHGCYVTGSGEIITSFTRSVAMMPENEAEKYLAILKRTMTGALGKRLIDICFATSQVAGSPEHQLLMSLRDTKLEDEAVLQQFYEKAVSSVHLGENYLILLAHDTYDVPFRGKDGLLQDRSDESYSYVLCAICPVKLSKSALRYIAKEQEFQDKDAGWVVSMPALGFLFPAFDGRRTNIYNALYYCKDQTQSYEDFVGEVFHTDIPLPAAQQKKNFEAILTSTLEEDCSFDVVQQVHEQLSEMIEVHRESKAEEPLLISQGQVRQVLAQCQVPEEKLAKFAVQLEEDFGPDAQLSPENLIDDRHFALKTPDVTIQVNPARSDLVQTRVIDGVKYILINAEEAVEVNGVDIHIGDKA